MKSYVIHLIRHGITNANLNGEYVGVTDVPLCSIGREQIKEFKNKYKYPKIDACYSSPLSRCTETCKMIYPEFDPITVDGLKECNFGDWEGKKAKELEKNEEFIAWLKSGHKLTPPNGEDGESFGKRLCKSFEWIIEDLMKKGITSAAIFAHGGVIMSILSIYGLPKKSFYSWVVSNCCGYSIRVTPSLWMRGKVFEVFDKVPEGNNQELSGDFKYLINQAKNLVQN